MLMRAGGSNDTVSGAVLAGGRSSRFGRDKALLTVNGEPLLARAARLLGEFCDEVLVIGGPERQGLVPHLRVIPDERPGVGPLGGIATALRAMAGERLLVVATDMPLLSPAVLRLLVERSSGSDITVPVVEGRTQQLCAVYARSCLPVIDAQLARDDFAVAHLLAQLNVRYVDESELRALDPDLDFFRNINHERDWQDVVRLLGDGALSHEW